MLAALSASMSYNYSHSVLCGLLLPFAPMTELLNDLWLGHSENGAVVTHIYPAVYFSPSKRISLLLGGVGGQELVYQISDKEPFAVNSYVATSIL